MACNLPITCKQKKLYRNVNNLNVAVHLVVLLLFLDTKEIEQ